MAFLAISSVLPFRRRWRGAISAVALVVLITACSSAETTLASSVDEAAGPDGVAADAVGPAVSDPIQPFDQTEVRARTTPPPPATEEAADPAIPVQSAPTLDVVKRQRRAAAAEPQPVGVSIDALSIDAAIRPVGVEPNGEMEIPGAAEVGWYRYGSRPGEEGSAVLAAHVDFNGQVGVFFELASGQVGDTIEILFSDGSARTFVVTGRDQFEKSSLPFDEIFRRDGAPSLVLITCGGDFNPSLRSYEDNVVLFAEPA